MSRGTCENAARTSSRATASVGRRGKSKPEPNKGGTEEGYASMSWIRRYRVEVPRPKVSALYPRRVPTRHPQPLAVFNRCFLLLLHVFERPRDGGLQPFLPVM